MKYWRRHGTRISVPTSKMSLDHFNRALNIALYDERVVVVAPNAMKSDKKELRKARPCSLNAGRSSQRNHPLSREEIPKWIQITMTWLLSVAARPVRKPRLTAASGNESLSWIVRK